MGKLFRACTGSICACLLSFNVSAQQSLVDIPDANFLAALKATSSLSGCFVGDKLDANCDGVKNLEYLSVNSKNISSIEGVQYFGNLVSLNFDDNNVVTVSVLPTKLQHLGCTFNVLTSLPALPLSLNGLHCGNNRLTELPSLPSGLVLLACSNNQLTTLPSLPAGMTSLECKNNKLTSLPAIPSKMYTLLCSNNKLTSLPELSSEEMDSLICANNLLTSLPKLPVKLGRLDCYNNKLTVLPELPTNLGILLCYNNAIRCLPFLPASLYHLYTDKKMCLPNIPNNYFEYYNSSFEEQPKIICQGGVENACKQYPRVTGRVYIDSDNNNTYTEGDYVYSKGKIVAEPYYAETDLAGSYQVSFEKLNTSYSVVPVLPNGFVVTPSSYEVSFSANSGKLTNKDFIISAPIAKDLQVSITPGARPRPGFEATYQIVVRNNGTVKQNANVTFNYDNHLVFVNSSPVASEVANALSWSLLDLKPFEEETFIVHFTLPATVSIGTILSGDVSVSPVLEDATPLNNTETLKQTVTGSYDPNDKQVDKGSSVRPAQITAQEEFNYTVRFQNTGTDTAYTVVIRDTLSAMFDISTLETVAASHNYYFSMKGNAASWTFDNIKLPDSTIDKAGSNGFVRYKIKPKTTVQLNDELENTAYIYFDFNEAVITNTTVTKVTETTAVIDETLGNSLFVYPNPSKAIFNVDFTGDESASIDILSVDGRVVNSLSNISGHISIDLRGHASGVYFLRITSDNLSEVRKLILE